ncbi:hypothetical protein DAPPUDRAFT_246337 [Daphnia pulex]|uniref:Peptidase S1 domain-containing protein n=1 Tax=Daphnia pulex TaxID=6669 RepID=E9GQ83_DAPPU|nr:hypothetical protein DAPPUDRAFT_246337 [Daphnia pulex]|eukprot:EFX78390.1 hypothetical protein DAPPUDRAFT_246337 [Daphnia pulex]
MMGVIKIADVGYAPSYHGKSWNGQIADPGFVPLPSFNPYPGMAFRQQQQDPNGWSYSFGYPNLISPADVSSSKQGGGATTTTTPAPAIQCGKGPTTLPASRSFIGEKILGSGVTTAKANAWPFMVALRKYTVNPILLATGINYDDFCSGTLISDSKVLLAATCLEKMSLYEMSGVTVAAGLTINSDTNLPEAQMTRRISKVVLHGQYNAFTYANDIAILTLDSPLDISRTVGPVCLAPANAALDQYADQDAVILGWATTNTLPPFNGLRQGAVSVSFNSECKADEIFGKYVTGDNICIITSTAKKFFCDEDVGGPVVVLSSPGIWTQIGINSFIKIGYFGET